MAEFRLTPPRDPGAMGALYGAPDANIQGPVLSWLASALAPNITSLARGEPDPNQFSSVPLPVQGKVPGTDDPRIAAALSEGAMLAGSMAPAGRVAMGPSAVARMIPEMMQAAPGAAQPLRAAPLLGAGAAAGGAVLAGDPASAAEGETPAQIKARQQQYKNAGFYSGKMDGVDGTDTQAAKAKFEAAEAAKEEARATRDLATKNAATAGKQAEADALRATNEAASLDLANKKLIDKQAGNERLKDIEKNVPLTSQIVRDYATPAGLLLGSGIGTALRYGVVKGSNALSQRAANKAEELFDRGASGIPNRTAKVNEFWRQGGAGAGEVPYMTTPARAPGKAVNEGAKEAENLFQPPTTRQGLTDVGLPGAMMAESLYSQTQLAPAAAERLQRALAAVNTDPSEANIKEYQAAKDNDAAIRFITNLGRGGAAGYGSGALKWQRNPSKPSMEAAEAERSKVDALVRAAQEKGAQPPALVLTAPSGSAPPANSVAAKLARIPKGASHRIWQEGMMPPEM